MAEMPDKDERNAPPEPRLLVTHGDDERGEDQPDRRVRKPGERPFQRFGGSAKSGIGELARAEGQPQHGDRRDANHADGRRGQRLGDQRENDRHERREIEPGMRGKAGGRGADGDDRPCQEREPCTPHPRRDAHETTCSTILAVISAVVSVPPTSGVRCPAASARSTARRTVAAARSFAEPVEHHRRAENRASGVRDALSGDVWRRAVHRLEQRRRAALRVEIRRWVQPEAAGDAAGQIAEDVAEEVRADDDVEAVRAPDELQRRGIDVQLLSRDVGVLLATAPQACDPTARRQIAARSTW